MLAIVQARMGSTRLPGKVLKEVNGTPLIEILFHRLSQSKIIDKIILATSNNKENERCDELAVKAVESQHLEIDNWYENNVVNKIKETKIIFSESEYNKQIEDYNILANAFKEKFDEFNNHINMNIVKNKEIVINEIIDIVND